MIRRNVRTGVKHQGSPCETWAFLYLREFSPNGENVVGDGKNDGINLRVVKRLHFAVFIPFIY